MATNCTIAVEHLDGTISEVYCHYDGYPSHTGKLLTEHYNTLESVEELISFGDMSQLRAKIHPTGPHSFEYPQDDVTIFYGRDRSELDTKPTKYWNRAMHRLSGSDCQYNYIFKNGEWFIQDERIVDILK